MTARYVRAAGIRDHVLVVPSEAARDARLSYRARGVLMRLLSNRDGYYSTARSLAAEGREGRDAVCRALRELREAGYLVQHGKRSAGGRWVGTDVLVYDSPQAPHGGGANRSPENPDPGFPDLRSSKSIKIDVSAGEQTPPTRGGGGAAGEKA